jgi:hypothetical protein
MVVPAALVLPTCSKLRRVVVGWVGEVVREGYEGGWEEEEGGGGEGRGGVWWVW